MSAKESRKFMKTICHHCRGSKIEVRFCVCVDILKSVEHKVDQKKEENIFELADLGE